MTEPDRHSGLFPGLIAVAIGIAAAGAAVAWGIRDIKRAGDEVTVTGSARRPIVSDFVIWRATVVGQNAALPEAYRELQDRSDKVQRFLKTHSIATSGPRYLRS